MPGSMFAMVDKRSNVHFVNTGLARNMFKEL